MDKIFFNAFHSPIGAHSSFTLGCKGRKGGLGIEMGKPADENLYIGLENNGGGTYSAFPFYEGGEDELLKFDHMESNKKIPNPEILSPFSSNSITRDYKIGCDIWKADNLQMKIISPVMPAPDPLYSNDFEQSLAYCPAVLVELTVDNRKCEHSRRAFFGYEGIRSDSMNILPEQNGVASGMSTAMITDYDQVKCAQGFAADRIFSEKLEINYDFPLGRVGLLLFDTPAGQVATYRIAVCFHRGGIVTTGKACSYWYTRYFKSIEEVGKFALENFDQYLQRTEELNSLLDVSRLNQYQYFSLAHSINSYYGSTQLLDWNDKPLWIVNEGEYRMMNTFDLTVDQIFFEMKLNPWTVKNELDMFVNQYSYTDMLHFPDSDNIYPGGLSFTHDMGCRNAFSKDGYSSYERYGLTGCFSHMTHEQLINWVLCASIYASNSEDNEWLSNNINIFTQCLDSMLNRDHPKPEKRNGIMALDSSRTLDGAEITTYDSLDQSLGQARNNVYIAVKSWAAYLALEKILNKDKAAIAAQQADKAAKTIASFLNKEGYIPAIMGESCDSRIIPAIEGLIFPYVLKMEDALLENGKYGNLIKALKKHFNTIFVKGICLYQDNGWKLSSSADNSWLSKIYLCQFVARHILGFKNDETGILADEAHQRWLLNPENVYMAWCDQMKSGVAKGSRYYPRGVTSILWLDE